MEKCSISKEILLELDKKIEKLDMDIQLFHQTMNIEGVWLFLATLGCWSVTDKILQIFGFILAAIFFYTRVAQKTGVKQPFKNEIKIIENMIISQLPLDSMEAKAKLFDLSLIEKSNLSTKNIFLKGRSFFLCYIFYVFSLVDCII